MAEFLAFVLPANTEPEAWLPYLETYRQALLQQLRNRNARLDVQASVEDRERFKQVFDMCTLVLFWNRLGTYLRFSERVIISPFMTRVAGNTFAFIEDIATRHDFMF